MLLRAVEKKFGEFACFCAAGMAGFVFAQAPAQTDAPTLPELNKILVQEQRASNVNQPGNNKPVWEQAVGGMVGYTTSTSPEAGVLIQPGVIHQGARTTAGQAWREWRNDYLIRIGGWAIVLMALVIAAFYAWRGTMRLKEAPTGRRIERFTPLERAIHWTTAITFCILALSGIVIAFGKFFLLPIVGYSIFGALTTSLKTMHNLVGPLFVVSTLVIFVTFVKDNFPKGIDFAWVAALGGLLSGKHVPSGRFNAGEKGWFWFAVTLLGLIAGATGLILDFPNFGQTRSTMQFVSMLHLGATSLFILAAMGHIYMGTIGVQGAYNAMKTGWVDDTWAKEHHDIWYEDVKNGKVPRVRTESKRAAGAPQAAGDD